MGCSLKSWSYFANEDGLSGLQIEGVLAYRGLKIIIFVCENDLPDTFYPTYYARI
jgi:hypothetical protein